MAEHPEACPEWRDDLVGWLVAQLPPDREEALQAHLATCATCRAEADSLLGVAAVALVSDPTSPPLEPGVPPSPDLGDRILASVASERRSRRVVRSSLAAVSVAAVALVGLVATRPVDPGALDGDPVVFARQPTGVEAEAVVAADAAGSVVELTISGLDPDTTYALWLTPPGGGYAQRIAAGTFRPDEDGEVDERLHSALSPEKTGRVWVTDPKGDITLDTEPA